MPDINDILSNLNSGYEQITDLIPDKVFFVDDFSVAKNEFGENYSNNPMGSKFLLLNSGKFLWVGIDGADANARNIRRYNSDFTLDETFVSPIFPDGNDGFVRDVVELSNGKLVLIGNFGDGTGKIQKLNENGGFDLAFDSGVHFNENAFVIKLLSDGNLLVGGSFNSYNGTSTGCLVKLSPNGVLDEAFTTNASIINNYVHAIKEDASGKIYVGGEFGNYIVRLNSDGTTDNTFNVGAGFDSKVTSIEIDSNGKILVGGWFTSYDENSCDGIVRLETNGDLDPGFATEGSGLNNPGNGTVKCIAIQNDNKILVGGWFNEYDGNRQGHIIRLNTDGTKDSSFNTNYGFGYDDDDDSSEQTVQSIIVNNNKILCVGKFVNYNGTALYGFASLDSDGSLNPNRLFKYTSFGISDGYKDMYDSGNFINTNLTQLFDDIKSDNVDSFLSIPNTHSAAIEENVFENENEPSYDNPAMDGVVKSGNNYFGSGSSYFTNMYPGMFVLVAENIKINEFSIGGDVGSDDNTQNASSVIVVHQGQTYTVFVKVNREGEGGEGGGGSDPSVNHLIIIPGKESGLTSLINEDGDDYDDHCIRGLSGRSSVYYILVARQDSNYLSNSDAENIAIKFLEVIGAGCGETTVELELSPDNPETIPNYRFDGEGNMDTAIVVDPITGKRRSIQRTGYFETLDECGNRRVVATNDGGTLTNVPTSWADALSSILTIKQDSSKNYLFINDSYVDYVENTNGDTGHEANNLMAFMDSVNISYETFTDISFSNLSGSGSKLLIPELASGNLLPDLSVDAIASIESFVSGGGDLIVFEPCSGDLVDFLNSVFNLNLGTPGGGESCGEINTPISLTGEGASLFPGVSAEIPNNNGSNSIDTTTFPAGSIAIYEGSGVNETVVAMIPYGSGKIYILGWDWYDAVPNGSQDGGWNDLLQAILES